MDLELAVERIIKQRKLEIEQFVFSCRPINLYLQDLSGSLLEGLSGLVLVECWDLVSAEALARE